MAVKITDICISCDACLDECPVGAIVDNDDNPTGEDVYYVYKDKRVVGGVHNDAEPLADKLRKEDDIVWDDEGMKKKKKDDRGDVGEPVIE